MRAAGTIVCAFLACFRLAAWTPEKWFDAPKSGRTVHYGIKGVLDWPKKMFEGRMALTWKNTGKSAVHELPFHLCLNAFRDPDAPLMKTAASMSKKKDASWGYCEIKSAAINGAEVPGRDGENETVRWYSLPAPVAPGGSVKIEIAWEAKFPEIIAGAGWTGYYLVASMWYPKIGAYIGDQWVCRPFAGDAAFQGNFGVYDVELSLPNALQLANTGTIVAPLDESGQPMADKAGRPYEAAPDPDRKLNFIHKIHAEDVQDFSWVAAPAKTWRLARLDVMDTSVFFYHIPKNGSLAERMKNAVRNALWRAEERFRAYPYPILSIVDLPPEASGAMPAPTLAMISNIAFDPLSQRVVPEKAVLGQLGRQLFNGPLASSPLDKCPMEAHIADWFADTALDRSFGGLFSSKRFIVGATFLDRYSKKPFPLGFLTLASFLLPPDLWTATGSQMPTGLLRQLEGLMGRAALEDAIRAYCTEMAFKRPTNGDFRRAAEGASGQGLGPFWQNHIEGGGTLDYRIQSVSRTADGLGTIALERLGDIAAPITLWARLENGQEIRQTWDGEDKIATFSFDSPISAAELDPDRAYPGLSSRLHTTYSAKPTRRGIHYWAQNLFGAIGGLLQGMGLGSAGNGWLR
jgi:hypothetical protein